MAKNKRLILHGLLSWDPQLGLALLLMDAGFYCVLHLTDLPEIMLGSYVRVEGRSAGFNIVDVDRIDWADA